jgi:uncharacterized coiled-coil protein SlyX
MYDREKIDYLTDRLENLEEIVKKSFTGVSRELDELEETIHLQQIMIKEFTKVLDIHFDIIKKIERK